MLTVESLTSELGLKVAAGAEDATEREIRWVHITELLDPTPWLSGGELLLTTGIRLENAEKQRKFIRLLADAGVAGLGFGGAGVAARTLSLDGWKVLTDPVAWALVVYGVLALAAFGLALQRGSVTVVAAVTFSIETVVPAAVGLIWLGDQVRDGLAWLTVLGFVLTLAGSVRLARFAAAESVLES